MAENTKLLSEKSNLIFSGSLFRFSFTSDNNYIYNSFFRNIFTSSVPGGGVIYYHSLTNLYSKFLIESSSFIECKSAKVIFFLKYVELIVIQNIMVFSQIVIFHQLIQEI